MKYWDIKYFEDKFIWEWHRTVQNLFHEGMSSIKISTSLHTKFVAETKLADGQLVRVMEKGEEIL